MTSKALVEQLVEHEHRVYHSGRRIVHFCDCNEDAVFQDYRSWAHHVIDALAASDWCVILDR
ncbi:hypothetical protein [Mycobacteroides chelonae]|uniref:hypothetical protein n=1 Tax=Mycobacteroides chelonae TaxID=1774 RepID=UPI000992CFF8|nr:hypothetical protein [Mycobacteroides chelonae]